MNLRSAPLVALAAAAVLAGCNGRVTLSVTDAPVDDATAVTIQFTGVDLEAADGSVIPFDFSTPRSIDLLALEGGIRAQLIDEGVDAGDYRAIRLRISADGSGSDSFIERSDGRHALELEPGSSSRLRVARTFSVADRDELAFTIDFDLRKSVLPPDSAGAPYRLRPALTLVADADAGAVAGTVSPDAVPDGCVPAVYAWAGSDVTPDDVGGTFPPLNTGRVRLDTGGTYRFRIGLLPAGAYTVALTCEAGKDQPDSDDAIAFGPARNLSVRARQDTDADF